MKHRTMGLASDNKKLSIFLSVSVVITCISMFLIYIICGIKIGLIYTLCIIVLLCGILAFVAIHICYKNIICKNKDIENQRRPIFTYAYRNVELL